MAMPFFAHSKIKPLRRAKGVTQSELAAELGISRPTYVLIEQGEREPTISQLHILARLLGVEVDELGSDLPHTSTGQTDYPKFKELVAICCAAGAAEGTITKTKLSLLTYLIDFGWYRLSSQPMTGQLFRHTIRGPVADNFFRALDELYEGQAIALLPEGTTLLIRPTEKVRPKLINKDELELIDNICAKWRVESTEALTDFVREQLLDKTYKIGQVIPYELTLSKDALF